MIQVGDCQQLVKGNVRVEWVNLGEGNCGEYDPDDPNDVNLLRFDISVLDNFEWVECEDASYCTRFPASATLKERLLGLDLIMGNVYERASEGHSIKKICEQLSWIGLDWIGE